MGAYQNNASKGGTKKKSRGSVKNADRLEAFSRGSPTGGADWGGCDPDRIQAVVVGITAMGGAVTFGMSKDQGAHSVTLMLDDSRQTLWFNGDAELNDELDTVIHTLKAIS